MRCPRCGGILFWDYDGYEYILACLCGYRQYEYTKLKVEILNK